MVKCPVCYAEMETDFLCHDEVNFDGKAFWFHVCYDCDYARVDEVITSKVDYYRRIFGFVTS